MYGEQSDAPEGRLKPKDSDAAEPFDVHFSTGHLNADIEGRSVRGGAVTLIGQAVRFLVQLLSTAVLARLLTPQDYGLFAMIVTVTVFVTSFKDMGLSLATVQKAHINHAQVSTLFWVNVLVGLVLMCALDALAPAIACFYKDERLIGITFAMAASFLLVGLTVQHQALLRRQMRFKAIVVIDILSFSIGTAVGIGLAWAGAGYWALIVTQLVTAFIALMAVWIACRWRPGAPVRGSGVRSMLAFGGHLTFFGIINYFSRNLDNVLIGAYWGPQLLGLYSRAYSLLLLPMGQIVAPITAVAMPALSRLQDEPERFRHLYVKAVKMIAYATMPIVAAMCVLSREVVQVFLGDQWLEAAPIFQILALAAIWQPVCITTGWIYTSLNETRRMARWGLISAPVIILSFFVGLPWGPKGVAACYALATWILVYPFFAFAARCSSVKARDVFSNVYRPFALSLVVGLAMYAAGFPLEGARPLWVIACALASGSVVFALAARFCRPVRLDILEAIEIGRDVFGGRRNQKPAQDASAPSPQ